MTIQFADANPPVARCAGADPLLRRGCVRLQRVHEPTHRVFPPMQKGGRGDSLLLSAMRRPEVA
jgi:hypothetical protein